ncbi:hypothetical protein TNCV_2989951 [Trichonephila clavipes]|nr:hypothetical protein TNCV_2989951 [Trichonephila clavipes]
MPHGNPGFRGTQFRDHWIKGFRSGQNETADLQSTGRLSIPQDQIYTLSGLLFIDSRWTVLKNPIVTPGQWSFVVCRGSKLKGSSLIALVLHSTSQSSFDYLFLDVQQKNIF